MLGELFEDIYIRRYYRPAFIWKLNRNEEILWGEREREERRKEEWKRKEEGERKKNLIISRHYLKPSITPWLRTSSKSSHMAWEALKNLAAPAYPHLQLHSSTPPLVCFTAATLVYSDPRICWRTPSFPLPPSSSLHSGLNQEGCFHRQNWPQTELNL